MFKLLTASALALTLLTACSGQVESVADKAAAAATEAATKTAQAAGDAAKAVTPGADITSLPAGEYASEAGHAYISFSYDHQGYSRPILRWGEFDARVTLNAKDPEKSTVKTVIQTASVDSGVDIWNEHLLSPDWFDAAAHPQITFSSTNINQALLGSGTMTGDLTIKGVTTPITFDVKLNKTGQHFRSKKHMFGISAVTTINRADYGLDKYIATGKDVDINLEIEFIKVE